MCWALLGAVFLLGAEAAAQDGSGAVRGVVYDRDFDAPLPSVEVTIVQTQQSVTTGDQGNFYFDAVPAGTYTLVFSKSGYVRNVKSDVLVTNGQLADLTVYMAGDFAEMEEFVVQDILQLGGGTEAALLELRIESPALMDSIGADLMSRAGASDAASALRLVSGASLQDGRFAVIRGLPDRYVNSQLNRVRLPSADEDKRAVELDQFPAAVIESIQVTKTFTPDQQGDASGGAVNIELKSLPEAPFLVQFRSQVGQNTNVGDRQDFLSYAGGGVNFWGKDDGTRRIQTENIGANWTGAAGVSPITAPTDYKWSTALGGKHDFGGFSVGGYANFFYERNSDFYDDGVQDQLVVERPGAPMTPRKTQIQDINEDFKTALFDVTRATQAVQWGGMGTIGVESEEHAINMAYLYTRTTEDTATLAEDTRGKEFFFPGYDPNDMNDPGNQLQQAAPWLRLETLEYTERTTETLMFTGRHTLPSFWLFEDPQFDWTLATSSAGLDQPDKRQFGSLWWAPNYGGRERPSTWRPFKPSATFSQGNFQRIFKSIEEDGDQLSLNLQLPFEQWSDEEGYAKVGVFSDRVKRTFLQETFTNSGDSGADFEGDWEDFWSAVFPYEDHDIDATLVDVDYDGKQNISAWYGMVDLPLFSSLNLIGGARFETTDISIVNYPEEGASWVPPGEIRLFELTPGAADVSIDQKDTLPSLGLIYLPAEEVTLRASYGETIARPVFKELTPIVQQEFLGGPVFVGNPNLELSSVRNYDLRADYSPYVGGLVSASWFYKDIAKPIEYVQRPLPFNYTTPVNYPKGTLQGVELELRQEMGQLWDPLTGLSLGGNATFINSEVDLPQSEILAFNDPTVAAPMTSRDMTNAPDHLYNLYLTYDLAATGTQFSIFYTVQGDTLVAGATTEGRRFIPNIYSTQFDNLNVGVVQQIGDYLRLTIRAKNLTNPEIQTVYRSGYIGPDVLQSSFTRGVEYSVGLSAEFRF